MNNYLFNHEMKWFTCENPQNTFVKDYSNGYPVQITTNVTKNISWRDILCGNYDYVNPKGTPEYLDVNGEKYTYIFKAWAEKHGYKFVKNKYINVSKHINKCEKFFKDRVFN